MQKHRMLQSAMPSCGGKELSRTHTHKTCGSNRPENTSYKPATIGSVRCVHVSPLWGINITEERPGRISFDSIGKCSIRHFCISDLECRNPDVAMSNHPGDTIGYGGTR